MAAVQILRIVAASPGDVQAERNALPTVVEELNNGIAKDRGLRLELARWETDAYTGFHPEGPQGLIDDILRIEDCDILIGIFWKRFGTPCRTPNPAPNTNSSEPTKHGNRRAAPKSWSISTREPMHRGPGRRPTNGGRSWNSSGISPKTDCGGRTGAK
jgi:hypothetical protein